MLKSCSRCGRIHPYGYVCGHMRPRYKYQGGKERELRNTWDWHKKSQEIRDRAQHLCEACRDKGRYVYDNLEVHHIEKLAEHPELLLEDENLVCLCVSCHKQADRGEIPKDYLRELARKRESAELST